MGQLRFFIPDAPQYDPAIWSSAYVSGIEGIPWAGKSTISENGFCISRSIDESGKLSIVWPTREFGPILVSTASLRCDDKTEYILPLELARGTLHRIRGRALDWQRLGLKLPDTFFPVMDQALDYFLNAVTAQSDKVECCRLAQTSIEFALSSIRFLTRAFITQSLQVRHQQEEKLSTLMGVRLGTTEQWSSHANAVLPAMNLAYVSLEWGRIEADSQKADYRLFDTQIDWARNNNIRVCGGPIISLQPHSMPNWLFLLDSYETLLKAACEFTQKTVERYRGKVNLWCAATGLNAPNDLGLTDDQILRLAVAIIQTIRRCDDRTPVIICLDMPWAEYLGQKADSISPLHFADALTRTDLGLSGLGLEMNMGHWPGGSFPRDLIDVSDLIDLWSNLGLPLMTMITTPASMDTDAQATARYSLVSQWQGTRMKDIPDTGTATGLPPNGAELVQMLLAKPNVHGVVWNQFNDNAPHAFANSGLINQQGNPRPLLDALSKIRQQHVH